MTTNKFTSSIPNKTFEEKGDTLQVPSSNNSGAPTTPPVPVTPMTPNF